MSEEIKTQIEQKNTVATVGMRFSIIGLIAVITVFLAWLGFPMLFVGFILGIIGLFHKPRGKARVAVIIPLVVFIALVSIACYIWNSVKTPANEFADWAKPQLKQLESENFDEDRFENILQTEINKITTNTSEEDRKNLYNASTGSNFLEKGSYLFFSIVKQSIETSLEKYNNDEVVEIDEEDNDIIDVDIEMEEDVDIDDEDTNEKEITIQQPKKTNSETFSQSEKNDIEQILNILE